MTRATNNTNKASGDASPFRRLQNHYEDDALISLLIRGQQQSSSPVTADRRIQRNSGTTDPSGTYVSRSGLADAMEELFHHTNIYSPRASPTASPQRRARRSLNPADSGETRRREMNAILSEACRLTEACQLELVEDDDEVDDL
jgi:hypothetical protein